MGPLKAGLCSVLIGAPATAAGFLYSDPGGRGIWKETSQVFTFLLGSIGAASVVFGTAFVVIGVALWAIPKPSEESHN